MSRGCAPVCDCVVNVLLCGYDYTCVVCSYDVALARCERRGLTHAYVLLGQGCERHFGHVCRNTNRRCEQAQSSIHCVVLGWFGEKVRTYGTSFVVNGFNLLLRASWRSSSVFAQPEHNKGTFDAPDIPVFVRMQWCVIFAPHRSDNVVRPDYHSCVVWWWTAELRKYSREQWMWMMTCCLPMRTSGWRCVVGSE